jgi:hypothetical protein
MSRRERIKDMIKALRRMKQKGYERTDNYNIFKAKLKAIRNGAEYNVVATTPAKYIASIGCFIPSFHALNTTRGSNLRLFIKKLGQAHDFIRSIESEG